MTTSIAKVARVKAWRAGGAEIVHVGFYRTMSNDGVTPLYRLACQGRNVRYLAYAEEDQTITITCQKCRGRAK